MQSSGASKDKVFPKSGLPNITPCFTVDDQQAKYDASCANSRDAVQSKEEL